MVSRGHPQLEKAATEDQHRILMTRLVPGEAMVAMEVRVVWEETVVIPENLMGS